MSSWPFLFAAALAIWLLLKGPAAKTPLFVQIVCRIAIVFLTYCGFLYLLKWDPFWKWILSFGAREPKQGRRLSDPDVDTPLDHCDTENLAPRFPNLPRTCRCAWESQPARRNDSAGPHVDGLDSLVLFLPPQVVDLDSALRKNCRGSIFRACLPYSLHIRQDSAA